MCPDLVNYNFEVLRTTTALYEVYLACAETVKTKPAVNNAAFITYSNTIYLSGLWFDSCVYLIN